MLLDPLRKYQRKTGKLQYTEQIQTISLTEPVALVWILDVNLRWLGQYVSVLNLPQKTRGSYRISIHMLLRGTETREDVNRGRTSSRCQTHCQEGVQKTRLVQKFIYIFILLKVLMGCWWHLTSNQPGCHYVTNVIQIQHSKTKLTLIFSVALYLTECALKCTFTVCLPKKVLLLQGYYMGYG